MDGQSVVAVNEGKSASTAHTTLPFGSDTVAFVSVVRASCAGEAPSIDTQRRYEVAPAMPLHEHDTLLSPLTVAPLAGALSVIVPVGHVAAVAVLNDDFCERTALQRL